jgi:hypothetical protein
MSRNFKIAAVLSLIAPVALILIPFNWPGSDQLDWPALPWFLGAWTFLSWPQLAIILLAVFWSPVRNEFATPALFSLTILETVYCCGITYRVPWYESGSTWMLYFPLLTVLLAVVALRAIFNHRRKLVQQSPGVVGERSSDP